MKKPDLKQLTMPSIIAFILIIASFTIASKYELKSIVKRPVKIISPAFERSDSTQVDSGYLEDVEKQEVDTVAHSGKEEQEIVAGNTFGFIPGQVSIILLQRLQISLSLPFGT